MRPHCIDYLSSLPHQKISRAVLHQLALLLSRFDLYETHGRTSYRLTDRLSVGGIVLVALDVGLHVFRRHQTHFMTEFRQLPRPIVRGRAGLHANQARRYRIKKLHHLAPPQFLPDDDFFGRVDAVDLEHVLGKIQTNRGNLHVDGSSHVIRLTTITLWHSDAGRGHRPPHQKLAMPIYCSPTALQRLFHHQGERAVAAAAAKFGTMFGVSSLGTVSVGELRKAYDTPQVYQFYFHKDRALNHAMMQRAKAAGVNIMMLTVDSITGGNRERDLRTGFSIPFRLTLGGMLQFAIKPMWAINYLSHEKFRLPQLDEHVDMSGGDMSIGRYL